MVSCNDRSGKLGECTVAPGVSQVVGRVYSNMFDTSGRQPDVKCQATNNPQRGRKNPQIAPSAVKYIMKAKHSCAYEQRPTPASGESNENCSWPHYLNYPIHWEYSSQAKIRHSGTEYGRQLNTSTHHLQIQMEPVIRHLRSPAVLDT